MPKLKLTSAAVERLKAPDTGQTDYFDTALPAFGLRVGRSKRMYFIIIRIHGKRSRITLGQARVGNGPGMTLTEARAKAGEVNEQAALGIDPRQQKAAEKAANRLRQANTVGAVADLYIEKYAKPRKRSWKEDQRILNTYVRPAWDDIPITEITKADVAELLDAVEDEAKKKTGKGFYMANRVLSYVRKLFNWAIDERALLDQNPVGRKMSRGIEGSRKRTFTDEEIKAIWLAADTIGGFKGCAIKMLMLTGQRVGVVAGMKRSEIDGDLWTIAGEEVGRSKNKRDHIVPLSQQALAVLEETPQLQGLDHVFSTGKAGDTRITIGSKMNNQFRSQVGFDDWCFQNLRSVVATKMRKPLGISPQIIDLVQGRVDSSVLSRHYDANDYVEEKRAALQAWANHLDELVSGIDRGNVVSIKEKCDG
jgi:integrase